MAEMRVAGSGPAIATTSQRAAVQRPGGNRPAVRRSQRPAGATAPRRTVPRSATRVANSISARVMSRPPARASARWAERSIAAGAPPFHETAPFGQWAPTRRSSGAPHDRRDDAGGGQAPEQPRRERHADRHAEPASGGDARPPPPQAGRGGDPARRAHAGDLRRGRPPASPGRPSSWPQPCRVADKRKSGIPGAPRPGPSPPGRTPGRPGRPSAPARRDRARRACPPPPAPAQRAPAAPPHAPARSARHGRHGIIGRGRRRAGRAGEPSMTRTARECDTPAPGQHLDRSTGGVLVQRAQRRRHGARRPGRRLGGLARPVGDEQRHRGNRVGIARDVCPRHVLASLRTARRDGKGDQPECPRHRSRPWEIATPTRTTTAPIGWFQLSASPRTTIPSTVENSGITYVTVEAVPAPAARTIA